MSKPCLEKAPLALTPKARLNMGEGFLESEKDSLSPPPPPHPHTVIYAPGFILYSCLFGNDQHYINISIFINQIIIIFSSACFRHHNPGRYSLSDANWSYSSSAPPCSCARRPPRGLGEGVADSPCPALLTPGLNTMGE